MAKRKDYGGSIYDQTYFTDDELRQAAEVRDAARRGETDWGSAHDYVESIRKNYGYKGGKLGDAFNPIQSAGVNLSQIQIGERPTYKSKYAGEIESLRDSIKNRPKFSYDHTSDPLFQQYKKTYLREGERAMDDTLASAAAMTGGSPSSAAIAAGQQANNLYAAKLNDKIPDLQKIAYDMYMDEGREMRQDLSDLLGLEKMDYGRFTDSLAQFNRDRGFAYDAAVRQDQTAYDRGRDQIMDDRYADELERKQLEDKANMMASAGDFSGFAALGYTPQQIQILKSAYDKAQAEKAAAAAAKKRGSGDSSKKKKDDFDVDAVDWSDVQDYVDGGGKADDYIGAHYKDLGFGSVSQAKAAWKVYLQENDTKKSNVNGRMMQVITANLQQGNMEFVQKLIEDNQDSMSDADLDALWDLYDQYS